MLSEEGAISTRWSWRRQFQVSKAPRRTGWRNARVRLATRVVTVSTVSPASTGNQALVVRMADACPAPVTDTRTRVILKRGSAGVDTTLLVSIATSVQLATTAMPHREAQTPAPLAPVLWWAADQVLATQCQEGQERVRPRSAQSVLRVDWELVVSFAAKEPGAIPRQILQDRVNHVSAAATQTSVVQAVAIVALGSA